MPRLDGVRAALRADPNQNRRANDITNEREQSAGDDEQNTPFYGEGVKLAEKQRNHERSLKRTHTAAGFFDSNQAGTDFDDIAMLESRSSRDVEERNIDRADGAHEVLHDNLLSTHRPRDGDEKKEKGESKMTQPGRAACEKDPQDRNRDGDERERPTQQAPVRICFSDKSNGEEK